MPTFLLKTEPSQYSFADLLRDRRTTWSGVSNPAALIALRSMHKGDAALIYHTGDERAIVGLARVASNPFEDPDRPGLTSDGAPRFAVVELTPLQAVHTPLSLDAMKADARFAAFELLRQSRLSVMPVPPRLDKLIRKLTGVGE